jgi:dephospho-CoA kinase
MIVIGITGIIGSGKTTASSMLKKKGITVIDLDALAKKAITLKEVQEDIVNRLGKEYIKDGNPVVERLRKDVFTNKEKLRVLESIIHPRVKKEMWQEIDKQRSTGTGFMVIDGPLLYETDLHKSLDKIVVVSADMEKIKERLRERGLSDNDMDRRISNQIPLKEKEKRADFIMFNNGTKKDLEKETEGLLRRIKEWEVTSDAS